MTIHTYIHSPLLRVPQTFYWHFTFFTVDHCLCVWCVSVFFPLILDIKFVGRTSRGHTGGVKGHTGFFIQLPSAVRVLIFLARRIQPFLSLVDREVNFLCTNDLIVFHSLGIFFFFFSEKNNVCRDRIHVPTCQKVTRLLLSYRGDRLCLDIIMDAVAEKGRGGKEPPPNNPF